MAFDSGEGVEVFDVESDPPKKLMQLPKDDNVYALTLSGDGTVLVTASVEATRIWSIGRTSATLTAKIEEAFGRAVAVSATGTTVAFCENGRITVFQDAKRRKQFAARQGSLSGLVFVGADSWPLLSASEDDGRLILWSEDGSKQMDIATGTKIEDVAVSHDRKYAATANRDGCIRIFRLPLINSHLKQ